MTPSFNTSRGCCKDEEKCNKPILNLINSELNLHEKIFLEKYLVKNFLMRKKTILRKFVVQTQPTPAAVPNYSRIQSRFFP